jgi:hypothetical protein
MRKPSLAEGAALARRKGIPIIFLRENHSPRSPFGWEKPLPCALPTRLRQVAFGM